MFASDRWYGCFSGAVDHHSAHNIFHSFSGIALEGTGHQLIHSVIIQAGWSGSTSSGLELPSPDIVFQAGVNIQAAPDTAMRDVAVAGAQSIGLMSKGLNCSEILDTYW